MKRVVTTTLALLGVMPYAANAQTIFDVNVKQMFAVPAENLLEADRLATAGTLTNQQFYALTRSRYADKSSGSEAAAAAADSLVRFTAVIMSDPLLSGNASINSTTQVPGRVHVFVRDVNAATDPAGPRGYVAQLVDIDYNNTGLKGLSKGDVVTITGVLWYFNQQVAQILPKSVQLSAATVPASILDPVTVSVNDLNRPNGTDAASGARQAVLNFANFNPNANEYVRVEGARVFLANAFGSRFNVVYSNAVGDAFLFQQDYSLRYRNDRNSDQGYINAGFRVRSTANAYVPPAPGSTVNVQGFTVANTSDFTNIFTPNFNLSVAPMEDGDVTVDANAGPSVANVSAPTGVVTGTAPVTITADAVAAGSKTISSVVLRYTTEGGTLQTVAMANTGGTTYSAQIPTGALVDGKFVTYTVYVTDSNGLASESSPRSFRVLAQGIRRIEHVQRTQTGGEGPSPFSGATVTAASEQMNVAAVVMTDFSQNQSFITVQDDPALGPWSGIALRTGTTTAYDALKALTRGQRITITGALVSEFNGLTQLDNVTFTAGAAGAPYADKTVLTTDLASAATAEAHESMRLRFENVAVTNANPDAPSNFGEFSVQSVGGTGSVRVNDASAAIADYSDAAPQPTVGSRLAFVAGVWTYSFSNFKLEPETTADVGALTVDREDDVRALGFGLLGTAPNPARGAADVRFVVAAGAPVALDVFDLLGRRVATLAAGSLAAGEQSVRLDASRMAPGVYVLRLTQGTQVSTKAFVVAQ